MEIDVRHQTEGGAKAPVERRRFRRVRVDLSGRIFVPSDSIELACQVVDLSAGGASLQAGSLPEVGTQIVLYLDGFGRFEGTVVRRESDAVGIRFSSTQHKLNRTDEQLALFLNKTLTGDLALRRHPRSPTSGLAHYTRNDGSMIACEVLNLSFSGVSVKTLVRPLIGEFVLIGKLVGRVARYHDNGIGIEFVGLGPEKPTADHLLASTSPSR